MPRKTKKMPPKGRGFGVIRNLFEGKRIIRDRSDRTKPKPDEIGKGSFSSIVSAPAPPRAVDIYGN